MGEEIGSAVLKMATGKPFPTMPHDSLHAPPAWTCPFVSQSAGDRSRSRRAAGGVSNTTRGEVVRWVGVGGEDPGGAGHQARLSLSWKMLYFPWEEPQIPGR